MSKKYVKKSGICIVQVPEGVNFGTDEDEKIVTVLFGIAGIGEDHLQLVQQIALFCSDIDKCGRISGCLSKEEVAANLTVA